MATTNASAADAQSPSKASKKWFVPLENNPEVMTKLLHKLGLSTSIAFHDVFGIDEPELLAFVPRPAYALLLVFPVSETYEKHRATEDADKEWYDGSGDGEEVMWYKQTIGNACGLIGLLHAVSNGDARSNIGESTDLATLLQQAIPLKPNQRADLLYESQALETAHQSSAQEGDTSAPQATDNVDLHYVCFVKSKNGHLWEMDGGRKGPLDRGLLDDRDDVLSERALDVGVRSFLQREAAAGLGDLRFSLIALAPSFD